MRTIVTAPSGKKLRHVKTHKTTPEGDAKPKQIRVSIDPVTRLAENRAYLKNSNVKAFLAAIASAEGGDYNLMYGGVKGKKHDPWQFSNFSTHPGAGYKGFTAAGMYQITRETWKEKGGNMGLSDFTPDTQDLIAVEILRGLGVIDNIVNGDIASVLPQASHRWAALPQGPDKGGRYAQPYVTYEKFESLYKTNGGNVK